FWGWLWVGGGWVCGVWLFFGVVGCFWGLGWGGWGGGGGVVCGGGGGGGGFFWFFFVFLFCFWCVGGG
ncbi:hypothetical protein PUR61_16750, partial [Streptomyces sp. BE20]|uniref:hypothetical protein n=1 Tax=Streptomyces sp. BE20 TaxID=3002525 RepID=UPI002E77CE65